MSGSRRPWTQDEHRRFLDALERFGNSRVGDEWEKIAREVGTRSYNEVKLHAHKYFLRLQAVTASKKQVLEKQLTDSSWTRDEDMQFENALAAVGDDVKGRWTRVAQLLPGRTAEDVRRRYQKLLFDVARLEAGEQVEVKYAVARTVDLGDTESVFGPGVTIVASSSPAAGAHAGQAAVARGGPDRGGVGVSGNHTMGGPDLRGPAAAREGAGAVAGGGETSMRTPARASRLTVGGSGTRGVPYSPMQPSPPPTNRSTASGFFAFPSTPTDLRAGPRGPGLAAFDAVSSPTGWSAAAAAAAPVVTGAVAATEAVVASAAAAPVSTAVSVPTSGAAPDRIPVGADSTAAAAEEQTGRAGAGGAAGTGSAPAAGGDETADGGGRRKRPRPALFVKV